MAEFPATGRYDVPATPGDFTALEFAEAQEDWLAKCKQMVGGEWDSGTDLVTVASGVILPTQGMHTIRGEGGVSDNLDRINYTNFCDGSLLLLRGQTATSSTRVTIRHAQGGLGQINLAGGDSYLMSDVNMILLVRRDTYWYEVSRTYDSDAEIEQEARLDLYAAMINALWGGNGGTSGIIAYGSNPGADSFLVRATSPVSMAIYAYNGMGFISSLAFRMAIPVTTDAMVAPTANPRIDKVVYNTADEEIQIVTGAEAASPSEPATPSSCVALATVYHRVGETGIYNTDTSGEGYITDVRVFLNR
jgi:hypothetical protein